MAWRFVFGLLLRTRTSDALFTCRGNDFDTLFAATSRSAAPRFLERHQKSECRILELQMTQHAPMLPHVSLQKREHMAE